MDNTAGSSKPSGNIFPEGLQKIVRVVLRTYFQVTFKRSRIEMNWNGVGLCKRLTDVVVGTIALFLVLSPGSNIHRAIAAEKEQDPVEVEQMVVTATRTKKPVEEVTADVELITEKEIKAAPANNVDDVLRRLGGVDIRRPSDFGITSPLNVNIRGVSGSKRVLMLVDGVPTNSAITGIVYPNQVQLSSVEQMELVKGAYSALYGSNAMGGVINIITKERDEEGVDITPMVKFGNFGLFEGGAGVSGRKGDLAFTLNASHRAIDNHYRRDKQVDYTYNAGTGGFDKSYEDVSDHSEYNDQRFFAKLSYDIGEATRLTLSGNYAQALTENGYTSYQAQPEEEETERTFYFLNLHAETVISENVDFDMRIYTNYNDSYAKTEHIVDNPGMGPPFLFLFGTRDYNGRDTGLQLKASTAIGETHYLTAGIDSNYLQGQWVNKEEDGTVIGDEMDESITNHALYLQNETELFSKLIINLGLRYDMNSESEDSLSPKIGFLYKMNERVSFRGSAGRAFRAPNLNELYTPTWMMVPGIPFQSNPDLEPEVIWSYDLGTTIRLTENISFSLTGFYSEAKDLISNPISGGVMRYENIDDVKTEGVEAGFDGKILSWLEFYLNYTYTHSEEEGEGRLDNQPLHQANAGLLASHTFTSEIKFTGTFDLRYNGEMSFTDRMTSRSIDLDPWVVVDLGLRLTLFERLGIQCAVNNLFDEEYEIHGSNLGPTRSYWVGLDYTF